MPGDRDVTAVPTLAAQLDRHDLGRSRGVVGIAVLSGDVGAAIAAWSRWHDARGAPWTLAVEHARPAVIRAYLAALLAGRDAIADVAAFLAPHAGLPADELRARLPRQGTPERVAFFRGLESRVDAGQLAVCQRLVTSAAPESLRLEPETVPLVAALRGGAPLPGLLLVDRAPAAEAAAWLGEATTSALELASAVPGFAIGLATTPERLDAFLTAEPSSYRAARLREGRIEVEVAPRPAPAGPSGADAGAEISPAASRPTQVPTPPVSEPRPADDAPDEADPAALERAARRARLDLEQARLSGNTLAAFDEAARLVQADLAAPAGARRARADDRARSAAERFLFQYLDEHPETRGEFVLNGTLPVRFGPRDVEVDLLSTSLAVAIEVDGYYHFRDADAFRRDRRKDVLLQCIGLLVVRCLANDVIDRLDDVMDLILQAVRTKKQQLEPPSP